jgi:flavin-dependent dehydrogenase
VRVMAQAAETSSPAVASGAHPLQLESGSRVAVVGSGPAGSFFSYFLLGMAERMGLELRVDIYDPRPFAGVAPLGCNMCGGIVSESLVQMLAAEGIILPPKVIQRGIDSYVLHMDVGSVRIDTPLHEMRIGAVHRGAGPRDAKNLRWDSFDGYLQRLAMERGAQVFPKRVDTLDWDDGRPRVEDPQTYDLLAVAVGVNSSLPKLAEGLGLSFEAPRTTKTFIREYFLGEETIDSLLGSSMHVFLLNIPRLEFAAIIPKGDYATICLLGEDIDTALVEAFMNSAEVKACLPPDFQFEQRSCQCSPKINVSGAEPAFADRVLFIGDSGTTRLYKDGIGAAYRTAKAAATAAVFQGISAEAFRKHFWPTCATIRADNRIGRVTFAVTRQIQKRKIARRAMLRMTADEQARDGSRRRMSQVLWDMFTGSAPYRDIFMRSLHPAFLGRLTWDLVVSTVTPAGAPRKEPTP